MQTMAQISIYQTHPVAQEKGLKALRHLCMLDRSAAIFAVEQGVLATILKALTAFPSSVNVQEAGTSLLRTLANPDCQDAMFIALESRPVKTILSAMCHEPWKTELRHISSSILLADQKIRSDNDAMIRAQMTTRIDNLTVYND